MQTVTNITLAFPNWFYGLISLGFIGVAFHLGRLHFQLTKICEDHPSIQRSLIRISEILVQKRMANDHVYVVSRSPVQLTQEGSKAVEESGFKSFYDANKQILLKRVKESNPTNLANLEEACKNVMLSAEDALPQFDNLKKFAYNRGEPIFHILFASSIALRDLFKDELNITE